MHQNGALSHLLTDHLGSTSVVADAGGRKVAAARYTAWGEVRYNNGELPTRYTYTGQYTHADTFGLLFYNARYYSPALARFVSADTLIPPGVQGLDRYAYVNNNPLRYTDPSGHCPWCIPVAIGLLKLVDWGWTAWDVYQSGRTLADLQATDEEKLVAGLNIALSLGLETIEPDDLLPASLPMDDIARRSTVAGFQGAVQQGGLRAGVGVLRETLGPQAPQVIRHMYDQGLFRGIRSYREWNGILQGVRQGAGLEVHHLIEQRFAQRLGLDPGDIPSTVLTQEEHLRFTSAWRQRIGYIGDPTSITTANATIQDIWAAAQEIYANYPDLLEAVRQALFGQ